MKILIFYIASKARLSPKTVKKVTRIKTSFSENSLLMAIAKVLAKANSSQFEKSDKHIKTNLSIIIYDRLA